VNQRFMILSISVLNHSMLFMVSTLSTS